MLESIREYKTLRAARIAATQLKKQQRTKRCNVFVKNVVDKRKKIKRIPAVFLMQTGY